MSVLSEQDIIKTLGKGIKKTDEGILIYPFKKDQLVGSSLCLTASKYAYSLHKKRLLGENEEEPFRVDQNHFFLPNGDTVLVYTNESIFISKHFCGSIHSKVGLASKGVGHIGTKVNPNWSGIFSIPLHNLSGSDLRIDTNEVIAYLRFYKLSSESSSLPDLDSSARLDVIPGDHPQELTSWINDRQSLWRKGSKEALQNALKKDPSLKELWKNEENNYIKSIPSELNRFFSEYLFVTLPVIILILVYLLAEPENINFIAWVKRINFKDWVKIIKDIFEFLKTILEMLSPSL